MNDILGQEVYPGDFVTEGRGKLYRVLETMPSFEAVRIAAAQQCVWQPKFNRVIDMAGGSTYVRLYSCLKLDKPCLQKEAKECYEEAVRGINNQLKEEIMLRRRETDRQLRSLGIRKY